MSYNGSGTFVINTAGQPVVSGTVISSTAFNALTADLATGLSTAITKDGQTTPTANIPMGNNKITGLAVGTAATDAATLSQVQSTVAKLLASVSGTDTITAVASPTLAAYAAGQMFYFVAAGDNTAAVTLNINSLGAKSITRDGATALIAGDIKSGEVVVVVYDGTQFQMVNAANSFSGNVTAAKFIPTGNVTAGNGMYLPTTNTVAFSTNGTEALRIDASQNLGLGVTPSAWNSAFKVAEIGAVGAAFITHTSNYNVSLSYNAYYDSVGWKYGNTAPASYYNQYLGEHKWFNAPSGTAGNAITFFEAMKLHTGGLNVGTASGNCYLKSARASKSTGQVALELNGGTGGTDWIIYQDTNSDDLNFFGNSAIRARITSGGVMRINTTSSSYSSANAIMDVNGGSAAAIVATTSAGATYGNIYCHNTATSGNNVFIDFGTEGTWTSRGSITYNRGAGQVAYNITSDVRLKDNIADAADAGDKVDALQVRQFDWKETGNHVDYGFVAQELDAVAPHAVSKPDDEDKMWSVDYSKLVPMLVKEVQSLRARLAALEAK